MRIRTYIQQYKMFEGSKLVLKIEIQRASSMREMKYVKKLMDDGAKTREAEHIAVKYHTKYHIYFNMQIKHEVFLVIFVQPYDDVND